MPDVELITRAARRMTNPTSAIAIRELPKASAKRRPNPSAPMPLSELPPTISAPMAAALEITHLVRVAERADRVAVGLGRIRLIRHRRDPAGA